MKKETKRLFILFVMIVVAVILVTCCGTVAPKAGKLQGNEKFIGYIEDIEYFLAGEVGSYVVAEGKCSNEKWSKIRITKPFGPHTEQVFLYEVFICGWNDYIKKGVPVWWDTVPESRYRKSYNRIHVDGYFYPVFATASWTYND